MGDKAGVRVQLDLLLSGKLVEVNAAGRKVHAVYSSRPTQRDHLMDTPCTGQVQSRGMSSCRILPLSALVLTDHSFQERTEPAFLGVYLDALNEEFALLTSISTHNPSSTTIEAESDDGQTEVGQRD